MQPEERPDSCRSRKTVHGRAQPALNVGCLAAQFEGQVSGREFDGVAVSGRPLPDIRDFRLSDRNAASPDIGERQLYGTHV